MPRARAIAAAAVLVPAILWLSAPGRALAACDEHVPHGAPLAVEAPAGNTVKLCKRDARRDVSFFLLRYDRGRAGPAWVAYELTRSKMLAVARSGLGRLPRFRRDPGLDGAGFRSPVHGDYTRSGYDRGHMAPAEAMTWDAGARDASFAVSNIVPQHPELNQQLWRRLEDQVRGWACHYGVLYVVTGALHGPGADPPIVPEGEGKAAIHVPTKVYKALYTPAGGGRAVAFVMDNAAPAEDADIAAAAVSLDALEAMAGLDLLPDMPAGRQAAVEAAAPDPEFWAPDYPDRFACTAEYVARVR